MKHVLQLLTFLLILAPFPAKSQGYHVRIGVIGNSITEGTGLSNPATQAYPIQLQGLLNEVYGDTCIVTNYGLTSTTLLKHGDVPYWATKQFRDILAHAPEVCIILLGTNDSKPQNWDVYKDEFADDYISLIDTLLNRNPNMVFMLGYPPPAFAEEWGIRDSVIVNGIFPAVDDVLAQRDAELVDYYTPLVDSAHLFPDHIHPNVEGAGVMAQILLEAIISTGLIHQADTGHTFITGFSTAKQNLPKNDSTTLTWTTINADSVFLNGALVESEGSLKISPASTTVYELIAKGKLSNDTIELLQDVYVPELDRLRISPASLSASGGDTIAFQVYYYDQVNAIMNDTLIDVTWEITSGDGELFGGTEKTVSYVAGSAGTSVITVSYGAISDEATITVRVSGIDQEVNDKVSRLTVYPNPASDHITILLQDLPGTAQVELLDLAGNIHYSARETLRPAEVKRIPIVTADLPAGNYILAVHSGGKTYTQKLTLR